ncbi:MAG: hypothetical protein MZV70_73720 [Desulfobacterales bacterium]|nr:hypothetical protein [Desulfobacterales bacterium]
MCGKHSFVSTAAPWIAIIAIPGNTRTASIPKFCQMESTPGRQDFLEVMNPVSLGYIKELLLKWVSQLPNAHHSISLTGGEPLLHSEQLLQYLPEWREILPIYLETNGIHFPELSKCIDFLDYISMDFKLPSTTKTHAYWEEHQEVPPKSQPRSNVLHVKIVVSQGNAHIGNQAGMRNNSISQLKIYP